MKQFKITLALFLILILTPMIVGARTPTTLREQMEWLHKNRKVNFVYDADIKVDRTYNGPSIKKMPLQKALRTLFDGTGIGYAVQGNYILLKQKESHLTSEPLKNSKKIRHTLSGYIRDGNGESLINATIYDLTDRIGTTTNEYGFYSITLPEGSHQLRFSYIGFDDHVESLNLNKDERKNITLKENGKLPEVIVNGDMNSPLLNTQTGKRSFSQKDIQSEFALLSSHDVVKTLQRTSGVAEGMELTSGLYVHGGNNDENLFLIDGSPLYQINHTMGLFSAFNVDMVKNVDFYKSGFPARYGGRLSSVIDVRTHDGDMEHYHGSYRIGLLDGSVQIEGPLQKGKTSFNFGIRRSWMDLISKPIFMIINHNNQEEDFTLDYYFHDLNAKITHIFNNRSKIYLSVYSGNDALNTKDKWYYIDKKTTPNDYDKSKARFSWGNLNTAINWNYQFSPKLFSNFTAVYTYNRSHYKYVNDDIEHTYDKKISSISYTEHNYRSTINDLGSRVAFDYRPNPHHHIRFGQDYTLHLFHPQTQLHMDYYGDGDEIDTLRTASANRHTSHEINVYGEDEYTINDHWSINGGLNFDFFSIGKKHFYHLDPRLAIKYQVNPWLSLKASYTMMTQFVHKISNSFLDLPTDYWVPTTERLKPMHSHQIAAGIYSQLNQHWFLSLEGYYKASVHLLQYANWSGLEPPAANWDHMVMDGKGRFYGTELDAAYRSNHLHFDASYTLSWNKRKYDEFYHGWYNAKFDNRHKINLTARYQLNEKVEGYAGWTFHTGNHMTLPTQSVKPPQLPGYKENTYPYGSDFGKTMDIFEKPNNITMPAYHRLDIGFNFHHTTKHGHERIWNLSIYNLYCHLNTMYVDVKEDEYGYYKARTHGYFPIIPSFSYTIKF